MTLLGTAMVPWIAKSRVDERRVVLARKALLVGRRVAHSWKELGCQVSVSLG